MAREVKVPDIGNYKNVPVIELLVRPGEAVAKDQGLLTLESDKATMEVPAPFAGTVTELTVKVGDEVSEGQVVALIEEGTAAEPAAPARPAAAPAAAASTPAIASPTASRAAPASVAPSAAPAPNPDAGAARGGTDAEIAAPRTPPVPFDPSLVMPDKVPHASPAVRVFARELGVDLAQVAGSGRKGRITREDVQAHVKQVMTRVQATPGAVAAGSVGGLNLLPWPQIDFARFGEVETRPLPRIRRISGANLARNWVMIPHVTQHDEADVTELEALRVRLNEETAKSGAKLTLLAFLIKASVAALRKFPDFNASLDASGENLVYKKYFHIGFAADTPNGLVVPVIRDADAKGVLEIARETGELAAKAREGKLAPAEMQGGCFSISSLGGIGGTAFTPIVNAPEVAILGVSKSQTRPVWDGEAFRPRLLLPLSLSYDHRVIDGAAAARFTAYLAQLLADLRRALL